MNSRMMPLLVVVAMLMLAVGCSTAPPAAKPDVHDVDYPQVTLEGKLKGHVVVGRPVVTNNPDAPMMVSVPVRLTQKRQRDIQYRFVFLDDRGAPVRPEMEWTWKQLPPRTQVFLDGAAMKREAVDWRLELRPEADLDER